MSPHAVRKPMPSVGSTVKRSLLPLKPGPPGAPASRPDSDDTPPAEAAQNEKLRPIGLAAGEFTVPDDFDDPLPEEILRLFEGSEE